MLFPTPVAPAFLLPIFSTGQRTCARRRRYEIVRAMSPIEHRLLIGLLSCTMSGPLMAAEGTAVATFAGGCFWCVEHAFDEVDGVLTTTSGYTGGHVPNPSYRQVSAGGTGHAEAVRITYDPRRIDYAGLLDVFWHNIDPTTPDRQFCDHGDQYRTAIFYHDEAQHRAAIASRDALLKAHPGLGRIVTEIVPAGPFYPAEEYHQDFHRKNPLRYRFYRYSCGRDQRLDELWGRDRDARGVAHTGPTGD